MLPNKHCLLFFFLCLLYAGSVAQIPGYKNFVVNEDNASIKIYSLFKNRQGYLFTGCTNGLYKFDGRRFALLSKEQPALQDTVTAIFEDSQKGIWTGYQSGRIARYTGSQLQYIRPEEGLPKKRITGFLQDQQHNMWFSTHGEGIYYFNNGHLYLINEENGLSDGHVNAIALASNGEVLAATDQGLNICSKSGRGYKVRVINPAHGLPDYIATCIIPAGNDAFWIGFQDKGFCHYDHSTKKITTPAATARWTMGQVNSMFYERPYLWVATQDSGMIRYADETSTIEPVPLPQKGINAIMNDNQGNIWVAADNQLVRTAGARLNLLPLYNTDLSGTIHAILVDHQYNYWAGSDMAVYQFARGIQKKYPINGLDMKTDITSLYEDRFHNIWVGTMGKGLFVLNAVTGQSRQLTEALNDGSNSILSISGNGSSVCTAGLEGAMVFELTADNSSISNQYHFTPYNNIETIGSTYIYNVFKDSRNRTWFATDGKGLTVLDKSGFTNYNQQHGIKDNHIYAVTEDKKGNIWFSTSSAGIYCFNGTNFINYALKDGLSNLSIAAIRTDRSGNVVVVHKSGLDILDPHTGRFTYINAAQQIPKINDDLGATCSDQKGDLYFSTNKGILRYAAGESAINYPVTFIESVQLFLNRIDTARRIFNHDENNFTFEFSGLYYTDPEHIFYRYKLDGFDSSWQFTTDEMKSFPKLAPGTYLFRIQSSLNSNFINATEAQYAFTIDKPVWRQWWFIGAYLLIGAGLLYWYIRSREKNLKKVAHLQEEKIKFKFEVLRNQVNPHFLFNSFNTLISTIEDDPRAAVEYVEQLSDFFRNLVNYRDKDTIPLREEKQMLASYLYMQQKRYGSSLQFDSRVTDHEKDNIMVPPLTLQLLVENAIKHNVVSKEATLTISIFTSGKYIIVQNNINKKISSEKGTGMGLQNIISRYAILTDIPVTVESSGAYFKVNLPIINR